jgi:hypothetical protein
MRDRLNSFDEVLSQQFAYAEERLSHSGISVQNVDDWSRLCFEIAASGWHTWESALAFVESCLEWIERNDNSTGPRLQSKFGIESLLECGSFGLDLAHIAHEPATGYFKCLREMLRDGSVNGLRQWQQTGMMIHGHFSRGSALLTGYFTVSTVIVRQYSSTEFDCWVELVGSLVDSNQSIAGVDSERPGMLHELFALCGRSRHKLSWAMGMQVPRDHLIQFLSIYPSISDWADDHLVMVCELVSALENFEDEPADFLTAMTDRTASVEEAERGTILRTCLRLTALEAAPVLAFLSSIDQLPVAFPEKIEQWVNRGLELGRSGRAAATAYFALESASSIEQLHAIKGQVNFDQQQRLFHLYSEGITGRKFQIEPVASEAEGYRNFSVARTDGKHIYLPDQISVFPTVGENRSLYKLTLLHQLGFFESGTFQYTRGDSRNPFADFFEEFEYSRLASSIFQILEDGRVDNFLFRKYKGIRRELEWLMATSLQRRPALDSLISRTGYLLEILVRHSLGQSEFDLKREVVLGNGIVKLASTLYRPGTTVQDTIQVVSEIYALIALPERDAQSAPQGVDDDEAADHAGDTSGPQLMDDDWVPEPVDYRGSTSPEGVSLGMTMQELEDALANLLDDQLSDGASSIVDPSNIKIEQFKRGEVKDAVGTFLTDLDVQMTDEGMLAEDLEDALEEIRNILNADGSSNREAGIFKYDEWDYQIQDYRKNWCRLHEIVPDSDDELFVKKTIEEHKPLLLQIKKQLQMLKPELQRKVKGLLDGEEIDLEGAIEAIIDRHSGISPTEKIYVQRQRKERDVSALFLLDMSASTDDVIPDPAALLEAAQNPQNKLSNSSEDEDDFLSIFYSNDLKTAPEIKRRIIDLEKESVVLMAEALEELGDSYAVHGFSGYGRDQVDYYVCKDFDERYQAEAKGRIGAIKPCRSTRMGPAIRHATRNLSKTESRIKALIIISDGYPQDFDYGQDRNNKDYGIQDTTKALAEARQKGVQAFCLTVDQSGHDYLREMCPDQQYMVIQDIAQLPRELSKVYQGLTT